MLNEERMKLRKRPQQDVSRPESSQDSAAGPSGTSKTPSSDEKNHCQKKSDTQLKRAQERTKTAFKNPTSLLDQFGGSF